ncbi:ribosomal protein S25 [Kipferlia bialata]|uniref:40S ribosomal protein S25 n=1 Tax=Kipferlia bialata TaxID=797122 RepID=A0A9K3D716_9EUKA|nr:ribosomal protein S25 [Kipferlia bialata]|eukprot:g11824.t1
MAGAKKWTKARANKDKANNPAFFTKQAEFDKLKKDAPKLSVVTVSELIRKYRISGSLARKVMTQLSEEGLIRPVLTHKRQKIYVGSEVVLVEEPVEEEAAEEVVAETE